MVNDSEVIYLDNNATTAIAPEVFQAMKPYLTKFYGNPSSMHTFGGQVAEEISRSKERIASLINCQPEELIFTSCGTESDNTAINAALKSSPEKEHIITTRVEHPAVMNYCKHLEREDYEVTYLPVDSEGKLNLQQLEDSIRDNTALITVMYANNETGVVFPIEEIGEIARSYEIPFHCDAIQAVGKLEIDMSENNVDFMAISGHKLHAPKGIGVLYVRKGTKFRPYIIGGHQENGRRAGTQNIPYIVGIGKAAELAEDSFFKEQHFVRNLRDDLESYLLENIDKIKLNGDPDNRLPNTSNISLKQVEGEAILLLLDEDNIAASSGSACTSGSLDPSHVLRAMGVPYTYAHGSIRLSLSRYNTQEEIDFVKKRFPQIIERLREISPYE